MMTGFSRRLPYTIVSVLAVLPLSGEAQRRPDFSGHWVLVEALVSGRGRDGAASEGPRRTTSTTISGAAFNCGRGCTITQKGGTLTIAGAQLAGSDPSSPVPSVTLRLSGGASNVPDSFNPPRELSVITKWQGHGLEIQTGPPDPALKQMLTIEKNELHVVTTNLRHDSQTSFRYARRNPK